MADYQCVIIGGGPGGYEAALRAAELGMKTALIEKDKIGGTCLNRGCVPTKSLLHAAELVSSAKKAERYGAAADCSLISAKAIFDEKEHVVSELRNGVEGLLQDAGVDVMRGEGLVQGSGCVRIVLGEEERVITAGKILIAAGAKPFCPPIPGIELDGVITSDDLLDGQPEIFESLVIIGGGVIGVELGLFYQELGTKVTILEGMDRLLPNLDKEIGQNLANILKKKGMEIYTRSMVSQIAHAKDQMAVTFQNRGEEKTVYAQKVLCAVGRIPCVKEVLDAGVTLEMEGRRIAVSESFETSIPGVYAIGDVSARIQLAHVASAQGRACVERFAGFEPSENQSVIPSCIFSRPEIACTGMSLEEAKKAGMEAEAGKYVMFSNSRTMIARTGRAFMKVVAEKGSHRILGAQLMCEHASDMLSEFTEAIVNEMTAEQMLKAIRPHPTFEEGVSSALRDLLKRL